MKMPLILVLPLAGVKEAPLGILVATAVRVIVFELSASVALTLNVTIDPGLIVKEDGAYTIGAGVSSSVKLPSWAIPPPVPVIVIV